MELQLNTVWKMSLLINEKKKETNKQTKKHILEDVTPHGTKAAMAGPTLRKQMHY